MKNFQKAGIMSVLIPAVLVYIITEAILRTSAVSSLKNVKVETVVQELPSSFKDSVSYEITLGKLRDTLKTAETPGEKAAAISAIAEFTDDESEKEKFFRRVYKEYPRLFESQRAYLYFLMNPKTDPKVSIRQFQDYIQNFELLKQYNLWYQGYVTLTRRRVSREDRLEFMMPLLDHSPEYRDYNRLYKILAKLATETENQEIYDKARKLEEESLDKPAISQVIRKREEQRLKNNTGK